ncbi:MAG: FAD-dependent oxidoreductase [Anaerolineaceae bacterium]|nr:FAD-dependent oxidoreductase [Anaerolineaceae bacterium]
MRTADGQGKENGSAANRATIYGAHWCPDCRRCKTFMGEHGVPYQWIDILEHPEYTREILDKTGGKRVLPTLVFDDGDVLLCPTNLELARKLDISLHLNRSFWPLIIIGAGPAGLTASLFTARDATETLVIEREAVGGNANFTGYLDNVPGFPTPITGFEFSDRLREQAEFFGVEILQSSSIATIRSRDSYHTVVTTTGEEFSGSAVIIATGSKYRRLNVEGEDKFLGNGVHYCAACDGPFYKGQHVAVLGGGNSAVEAALDLAGIADRVSLLVRGKELTANTVYQDKLHEQQNVSIRFNNMTIGFEGRKRLRRLRVRDVRTGVEDQVHVNGAFVFIGLEPNTSFLNDTDVELNRAGFILTGHNLPANSGWLNRNESRSPLMFETSVPGIFAAGDVREGSTKQVASAAGEGVTAAMLVREYLKGVRFRI